MTTKTNGKATDEVGTVAQTSTNRVLTYRRNHPQNRCSYGIAGVSGIVVFDLGLFANGAPPPTITVDVDLALPKAVPEKLDKAQSAAARAAEKATKAAERLAAQTAKAAERQAKADLALAKAKEKAELASKAASGAQA